MPFLAPLFAALVGGGSAAAGAGALGAAGAATAAAPTAAGIGAGLASGIAPSLAGAASFAPALAATGAATAPTAAGIASGLASGITPTIAGGASMAAGAPAGLTEVGNFLTRLKDSFPQQEEQDVEVMSGAPSFGGQRLPRSQIASRAPSSYQHPGANFLQAMMRGR